MPRGAQGIPHNTIHAYIHKHPGVTVLQLSNAFKTTRAAMARRLTDLFAQGAVVKKPNGVAEPVSWFVAGKLT
jgi:predicted ArsR family transcriptional regulator